jgi:hypothetical protein
VESVAKAKAEAIFRKIIQKKRKIKTMRIPIIFRPRNLENM